MSEFNEFDEQGSAPNRDTGSIISHAFDMYKGVFVYVIVVAILISIGEFIVESFSGNNFWSSLRDFRDYDGDYSKYSQFSDPRMSVYFSFSGLAGILLSPLYVGLIYVANKFNTKVPIEFSDLFIGYRQNLGNILLYSLITTIIFGIAAFLCLIPFFFVYPLFLLGYPILLFENTSALDALNKTYNIAKENYGIFLGTALLGGLISISGIVLCCFGIIFTLPFITIVMYSTYCAYLGKPRQITYK